MESEKFNTQIAEALRRTQATPHADMTERFMERLRREGLPQMGVTHAKPKHRHLVAWFSGVAAVAAVVAWVVLLPLKEDIPTPTGAIVQTVTMPAHSSEGVSASSPTMALANLQTPKKVFSSVRAGHSEKSAQTKIQVSSEQPEHSEILVSELPLPSAPPTQDAVSKALEVSKLKTQEAEDPNALSYSPYERELIAHAEAMREVAELYTAEVVQEDRIAIRERDAIQSMRVERVADKDIIRKI